MVMAEQLQKKYGGTAADEVEKYWPPKYPSMNFGVDPKQIQPVPVPVAAPAQVHIKQPEEEKIQSPIIAPKVVPTVPSLNLI